jgi:hypothetical protein
VIARRNASATVQRRAPGDRWDLRRSPRRVPTTDRDLVGTFWRSRNTVFTHVREVVARVPNGWRYYEYQGGPAPYSEGPAVQHACGWSTLRRWGVEITEAEARAFCPGLARRRDELLARTVDGPARRALDVVPTPQLAAELHARQRDAVAAPYPYDDLAAAGRVPLSALAAGRIYETIPFPGGGRVAVYLGGEGRLYRFADGFVAADDAVGGCVVPVADLGPADGVGGEVLRRMSATLTAAHERGRAAWYCGQGVHPAEWKGFGDGHALAGLRPTRPGIGDGYHPPRPEA